MTAITDVPGILVGHFTDPRRPTGCTAILTPDGALGAVDVRGAAPGTRETDLLDPANLVDRVHAIMLSGGSAFGLAAAHGAMRWLEENGHGFPAAGLTVPIVPSAVLFDLQIGDAPHPSGRGRRPRRLRRRDERAARGRLGRRRRRGDRRQALRHRARDEVRHRHGLARGSAASPSARSSR